MSYKSVEIVRFDFITSWCAKEFCAVSCQDEFELWSDHQTLMHYYNAYFTMYKLGPQEGLWNKCQQKY